MVICLERDADLHMAQLMPLPLAVSCFSKIQIDVTFLVPAHPVSPGIGPLNGCVRYFFRLVSVFTLFWCSDEGVALATRKTAHQLSHERAELRYQSRIPAWQRQQQEQEQESVTSSGAEQEAILSTIARLGRQRCNIVRRCAYVPRH